MRFSDEFLTELRSRVDIEELVGRYTEIRHRGSRTPVALCPFHTEKPPSFVIYRENQSYYCFGCGAGGDAITFVKNIERLDYVEAVRYLCERVGMNMPMDPVDDQYNKLRRRCFEANREAAKFFYSRLISEEGAPAREYLKKRRLTDETVKHFGLGYAPDRWDSLLKYLRSKGYRDDELVSFDLARKTTRGGTIDAFRNRLMFPIIDLRGNVIAFGGRVLDDSKPKYLNTSDTVVYKKSQGVYALNFAKNNNDGKLILCEGYMDVIAMHQAGFTNAVAGLGTAFTQEQISLLSRYCTELTLCFDSDEAGVKATNRALKMLEGEHDFLAFRASGGVNLTTVRTIYSASIEELSLSEPLPFGRLMALKITGNGFLYKMVRTIAGTLRKIGRGQIRPEAILEAYETGDRTLLGPCAEARGLMLMKVVYDKEVERTMISGDPSGIEPSVRQDSVKKSENGLSSKNENVLN